MAATLHLLLALAVVAVPLMAVAPGHGERLTQGSDRLRDYFAGAPQLPRRLADLPVVGERLTKLWNDVMLGQGGIRAVVPGAILLSFVTLLLALSQIGAPLIIVIWAGAAVWLFGQDQPAWGVFMIFWGLVVTVIDNFIKPFLIGAGAAMPLSLTILGVFGGFVAFGFLGLFIGPTLLAVAFTLLDAWRGASAATPGALARCEPAG